MGTTFWTKATEKEMDNFHVAFEVLKRETLDKMREGKVKPVFKYVGTHMIFDIKMGGKFTHKARLVAGVHKMTPLFFITYSSVVTRESVRLAFLISGLNNIDICPCDIGNTYLNAPCR